MRFRLIGLIGLLTFLVSFISFAQPGTAQAALTLGNFSGVETGDFNEAPSTAGTPTIETTIVKTGDFSLLLNAEADEWRMRVATGGVTDQGNDYILQFHMRFDAAPAADDNFLNGQDDGAAGLWFLRLDPDRKLRFDNFDQIEVVTGPTALALDEWHLIQIRLQHSDSGEFDLFLDGVSEISETGVDMSVGGTITTDNANYKFEGIANVNLYIDNYVSHSGGSATSDFFSDIEIFRYQNRENSTTSDASTCVSLSNNLDQGVWQDLGETPLGADAGVEPAFQGSGDGGLIFTDDTQSGNNGRHGPHGDPDIDGDSNIRGAKWLHRLRRGTGGSATHTKCYGNDADAIGSATVTLGTSFANFFTISTAATEEPLSTEHFAQGMHTSGPRDVEGEEFWSFILHVPDAGAARRIFPVQ